MSDLTPRSGRRMTRRERTDRAYALLVTGGVAGAVAVIGILLAVLGVIGGTIPVLALVVAVICALLFRRTVSGPRP